MIYDEFAQKLMTEYRMFLIGLTGRYLALMAPGVDVSPMAIGQLEASGKALRSTYMAIAERSVNDFVEQMSGKALADSTQAFMQRMSSITLHNIQTLTDRMKGMKNNSLDAVKENMHGAMGLLLQRQLTQPEFTVQTASGRNYKADSLVRTEARQFGYRAWLESEMERIAESSDLAEVRYADPEHENHGLVFSISGKTQGYPSFEDISEPVFHYNSKATVAPHVPA